jgi:3-methyladenine DNA glycosylase AlkD
MTKIKGAPTRKQAETLELVSPILTAVVTEMRELSKKKQDGILSVLKVRSINRLLEDVKSTLADDPSTRYLDLLDEDELPQNSDAVLILTQWEAAVKQYKDKHQEYDSLIEHEWMWKLADGGTLSAQHR